MKKLTLSIAIALIALCNISTAQEVRLDSLWAKLGGVFAMKFSPDSKRLIIGENGSEGQIRVFDAQTGIAIDSIAHSDFVDFEFTPDGQQMMTIDHTTIKFYNSATYKLERTIPYDQGGLITFSSNASIVSLSGNTSITIFDIEKGEVLAKILRPDKYNISPNQTEPYFNGKVCFSADGKYIIGKYANILVQWDWRTTPDKPEQLIPNLPNRAIIGFSPDKTMFVQQSNYLWSIADKKQIQVDGIGDYDSQTAYGFASTIGGSCMTVTAKEDHTPKFVNIPAKRTLSTSPIKYFTLLMAISPDSSYFVRQVGSDALLVERLSWGSSHVPDEHSSVNEPTLSIHPHPAQSGFEVTVTNGQALQFGKLILTDMKGVVLQTIYSGNLSSGIHSFAIESSGLSSGYYTVLLKYGNKQVSVPFIIKH